MNGRCYRFNDKTARVVDPCRKDERNANLIGRFDMSRS